ncbi:GNAT family N-acetyltransferase [Flavobacterium sp. 3HN19-14]|uniref:GNAT family N-acetyltransferase n=1 Tax=Flavobacterium sp. 3HN19-14 TaxID=3448133 RepID=UPI003EE00FFB
MIDIVRTTSENPDFISLVKLLDADLKIRDGEDHAFYAQFNKTYALPHCLVAYESGKAVATGAIRELDAKTTEVKRMFVQPEFRGKGIAIQVLAELEKWAAELGYEKCMLETGINQPEAIALYKKCNYKIIPNYGQYAGIENSVCFEKVLRQ